MAWKGLKPTQFTKQVIQDSNEHLRKVSGEMLQGVIMASPVMDGTFRGNHRVAVNGFDDTSDLNVENTSPKGTLDIKTYNDGLGKITGAKIGDFISIQNNLPYAVRLENGYSKQAPTGIYSLTFIAVSEKYR